MTLLSFSQRVRLRERVRTSTILIPLLFAAAAAAFALLLPEADEEFTFPRVFGVGASQVLLGSIATGLITLTSIAVSISIAGLSFGSSAMSPRILRWWSLSQKPKLAIGMFIFTFTYALIVLGRIGPSDNPEFVPHMSVWLSIGFLLLSIAALLWLMRYMSATLRVVESMDAISRRGSEVIRAAHPVLQAEERGDPPAKPTAAGSGRVVLNSGEEGVIVTYHEAALVEEARRASAVIELIPSPGSFLTVDEPLFRIHPDDARIDESRIQRLIAYSDERTLESDPLYAIRLLADMAVRALSPAINDPGTAVQALDRLEALLQLVGRRTLRSGRTVDGDGELRLVVPFPDWDGYLDTALTEIRRFGEGQTQIARRLRALLEDLLGTVPDYRRPSVERHLRLLEVSIRRGFDDPDERALASVADAEGLGAARTAGSAPA